jgi:Ca2+-binding EF-hand superfamily protein
MCGLGGAFGVAVENMPKPDHIGMVVDLLYTRINAAASSRVKEMLSHGDNQVRTAVVQAIKARQKGVESSVVNCGQKFLSKVEGHLLSYSVLREWCCAELLDQDPLSLPFRLAIMRFCPLRQGDFADEYCDDLKEFQLSHDERVIIPEDKSEVDPKDMLNRAEVAYIHEVLNYCHHHFKVSLTGEEMNHIALQLGMQIGRPVKLKLMSVLEVYAREVDDQRLRGIGGKVSSGGLNSINLINVLRRMCPSAQPKHLRMCEVWVSEYENLASVRTSVEDLEQAAALYLLNDQKPFLPQNELEILNREFDQLDAHRRGYITLDDIAFGWNWTTDVAQATLASYDLTGDGYIDRNEFLRMMCPSDYRLPEMAGVTRQMFGKVLTTTAEQQRRCLDNSEVRFTDASTEEGVLRLEAPRAVLPLVSTEDWAQWNHVFDSMDRNSDGKVHKRELMSSGLLSASACDAITALIDPEDKSCFTKRAFLDAMLKAHDCREPNSA